MKIYKTQVNLTKYRANAQILLCLDFFKQMSHVCVFAAFLAHQRDPSVTHQVEALKSCISVFFAFQRKPTKDDVFTKDVRQWLSLTVSNVFQFLFFGFSVKFVQWKSGCIDVRSLVNTVG